MAAAAADAVSVTVTPPHPKSMAALFARRTTKPVMKFLEINLICAQSLQPPKQRRSSPHMQTYAVVSLDKSTKLTSRLDSFGGQNPTWNDKFVFRVPADFLASETTSVSVEIYAVGGFIKDLHVGSARVLLSTSIGNCWSVGKPSFSAVQVQCPSSQFQGLVNVGVTVYNDSYFSAASASGSSAFCFSDLVGDSHQRPSMVKSWRSRSRSRSSAAVLPCQLFDWTHSEPWSEERKSCRDSLHQQITVAAPVLF